MQFLYPTFLFALAALAIPIIIHLFYFRRFKRVYFTNVRFLKSVKEETSARSRLRNLLVLLMRCLAVAFLVFAFAQPFIPLDVQVKTGQKAVGIYVDNSFSMNAESAEVPLLQLAKRRALEIVGAYGAEDRFQVLTNDLEGRHQRLVSKEDALTLLEEIQPSPAVRPLSQILLRQKQVLDQSNLGNKVGYLISDFQRTITDLSTYQDSTIELNLVPLQAVQTNNVSIDSIWFEAPVQMVSQTNRLLVKINNLSNEAAENVRLTLNYGGQLKPMGSLQVPASGSVIDTVPVTAQRPGWQKASIQITDFPVRFDDTSYFAFNVAEKVRVLSINDAGPNRFLTAAFGEGGAYELTNQSSSGLDYAGFSGYQLIVLNELGTISSGLQFELNQYVQNGGNVLFFPKAKQNPESYNGFLRTLGSGTFQNYQEQRREVGRINTEEFIFRDVFENEGANLKLPGTQANYLLSSGSRLPLEPLLTYRDGGTYLAKYASGSGNFYLCVAPLQAEINGLVRNAEIFIPMVYKMALSSRKNQQIAYTIGQDEVLEVDNQVRLGSETVFKIRNAQNEFIPEQRTVGGRVILGIYNQIKQAGFYDLFLEEEGPPLASFAFNFDRTESDLSYLNSTELSDMVGDRLSIIDANARANFTTLIGERSRGVVLWRWCVILALLFLALEVLLLRFWKA